MSANDRLLQEHGALRREPVESRAGCLRLTSNLGAELKTDREESERAKANDEEDGDDADIVGRLDDPNESCIHCSDDGDENPGRESMVRLEVAARVEERLMVSACCVCMMS